MVLDAVAAVETGEVDFADDLFEVPAVRLKTAAKSRLHQHSTPPAL